MANIKRRVLNESRRNRQQTKTIRSDEKERERQIYPSGHQTRTRVVSVVVVVREQQQQTREPEFFFNLHAGCVFHQEDTASAPSIRLDSRIRKQKERKMRHILRCRAQRETGARFSSLALTISSIGPLKESRPFMYIIVYDGTTGGIWQHRIEKRRESAAIEQELQGP